MSHTTNSGHNQAVEKPFYEIPEVELIRELGQVQLYEVIRRSPVVLFEKTMLSSSIDSFTSRWSPQQIMDDSRYS